MISYILDILTQKDKELILGNSVVFNYCDQSTVDDQIKFLLYVCYFFKSNETN